MKSLELISFALDILLIIAAVVSYLARPRIGGQLAKGLRVLMVGVMVLGLAHFVETLLFVLFNLDRQLNEVVHRLLIGSGFVFVILGFYIMRRAFDKEPGRPVRDYVERAFSRLEHILRRTDQT